MSSWVNANVEKPEGKVLMCFGEPFFGKCSHEIEAGYFDDEIDGWRFWLTDKPVVGFGVTYWMHLPDIPADLKGANEVPTSSVNR